MVCLALFTATSYAAAGVPPAFPLVAGFGGLAAGALVGWSVARPLGNAYYRAVLAMISIFGTALVAALTVPAHALAGRAGLAVLGLLCIVAIGVARRRFLSREP